MNTEQDEIKLPFPYTSYFHQLFFSPLSSVLWNPKHFWNSYTVEQLEQSLKLDYIQCTNYIQFLERCLQMKPFQKSDPSKNCGENRD